MKEEQKITYKEYLNNIEIISQYKSKINEFTNINNKFCRNIINFLCNSYDFDKYKSKIPGVIYKNQFYSGDNSDYAEITSIEKSGLYYEITHVLNRRCNFTGEFFNKRISNIKIKEKIFDKIHLNDHYYQRRPAPISPYI